MKLASGDQGQGWATRGGRTTTWLKRFVRLAAIGAMLACSAAAVAGAEAAAASPPAAHQPRPSLLSPLNAGTLLRPSAGLAARPPVGSSFPAPGTASALAHVACTSASDCWAVGGFDAASGATLNQVLHWNGTAWSQVSTPEPGGTSSSGANIVTGVACTSASSCWAVGDTGFGALNEALRWNGEKWSVVLTPQPGGTTSGSENQLVGVACTSASSCWAVGFTRSGSTGPVLNEVLHWNGTAWSQASTPEPGGTSSGDINQLGGGGGGVTCTSAASCWAVGVTESGSGAAQLNEALHWNGTSWSQISTPEPGGTGAGAINDLAAVTCRSASSCSAVGVASTVITGAQLNEVFHWDGDRWVPVPAIDPGGTDKGAVNELFGAVCPAKANCWAVGQAKSSTGLTSNEALQWTGGTWLGATTPEPGGTNPGDLNELIGVTCASSSDCWAVGALGTNVAESNQILHWNGKKWTLG